MMPPKAIRKEKLSHAKQTVATKQQNLVKSVGEKPECLLSFLDKLSSNPQTRERTHIKTKTESLPREAISQNVSQTKAKSERKPSNENDTRKVVVDKNGDAVESIPARMDDVRQLLYENRDKLGDDVFMNMLAKVYLQNSSSRKEKRTANDGRQCDIQNDPIDSHKKPINQSNAQPSFPADNERNDSSPQSGQDEKIDTVNPVPHNETNRTLSKAEQKRIQWQREREEQAQIQNYNPWGKPGAGAPPESVLAKALVKDAVLHDNSNSLMKTKEVGGHKVPKRPVQDEARQSVAVPTASVVDSQAVTFSRGRGLAELDERASREAEIRRQKMREHQEAVRLQIEEQQRRREEEREKQLREEQEEEERLKKELSSEHERVASNRRGEDRRMAKLSSVEEAADVMPSMVRHTKSSSNTVKIADNVPSRSVQVEEKFVSGLPSARDDVGMPPSSRFHSHNNMPWAAPSPRNKLPLVKQKDEASQTDVELLESLISQYSISQACAAPNRKFPAQSPQQTVKASSSERDSMAHPSPAVSKEPSWSTSSNFPSSTKIKQQQIKKATRPPTIVEQRPHNNQPTPTKIPRKVHRRTSDANVMASEKMATRKVRGSTPPKANAIMESPLKRPNPKANIQAFKGAAEKLETRGDLKKTQTLGLVSPEGFSATHAFDISNTHRSDYQNAQPLLHRKSLIDKMDPSPLHALKYQDNSDSHILSRPLEPSEQQTMILRHLSTLRQGLLRKQDEVKASLSLTEHASDDI